MSESSELTISIITVCYNSEKYIASAIESVISQSYKNIEYIIIDGGSTDNTREIIESYSNKVNKYISEPDKGIYDAMNKGIRHATGNVVGILNSDDYYKENDVISKIMHLFQEQDTDCVYANIDYVNPSRNDRIVRKWVSGPYIANSYRKGWHPAHPGFFVKKEFFESCGNYDLSYTLAADFELMLRFFEKCKISSCYFPESIINMRLGGETNKNLKNILIQNIENVKAFKKNKLPVSILYPILRLAPKVKQFF